MNPELLKKCLSGKAKAEEWAQYLDWLEGNPQQDAEAELFFARPGAGERIWEQIQQKNKNQSALGVKKLWSKALAGAACLAMICSLGLWFFYDGPAVNESMVFRYQQERPWLENHFKGMEFRLTRNSEVTLEEKGQGSTNVQFSGQMMLSNHSGKDKETEIFYQLTDGKKTSKKVLLRKGKTYFFAYYPFKEDQLVVVEDRAYMDIPPALAINLKNDFKHL